MSLEGKTSSPKITPSGSSDNTTSSGGGGGGYSYGGGGGRGYGGGSSGPDADDLQAQLDVVDKNYDRDVADLQNATKDTLDNINKQRKANAQQLLMKSNQINRNSTWQPNQQKEQSTYAALRRTMGNAAYGSGLADLNEGMARFDDMADVDLINTWKDNQNNAYNNWYQANSDLISDYNDKVNESNQKFANLYDQYVNNIASINAGLANKALSKSQASIDKATNAVKANQAAYNTATKYTAYQNAIKKYTSKNYKIENGVVKKKKGKSWVKDNAATNALTKAKNDYLTANKKSALTLTSGKNSYNVSTAKGIASYASASAKNVLKNLKIKTSKKNQTKLTTALSKVSAGKKLTAAEQKLYNKTKKYVQSAAASAATKKQQQLVANTKVSQKLNGSKKSLTIQPKQKQASGYTYLTNKASADNPNIPNSPTGATDYIRGTDETNRSLSKANMAAPNTAGAASTQYTNLSKNPTQYWDNSNSKEWYRAAH